MRYKTWDPDALEIYDRAALTYQQRAFTEGLLRSLEVGTYLSERVVSANSVVLALTRAHHALDEHARVDQPQIRLTRTILSLALSDVASGSPAYATTPVGTAMITQAQQTLAHVNASMAGVLSSSDKQQLAEQMGSLVQPAVRAVHSIFQALWSSVSLPAEVASRIRDEVAVLVALEGRDGVALRVDLFRQFSHGVVDAATVADILWPARKQYRVALVVSGTRVLEGLDRLLPGARQWPLVGPKPPAGISYLDTRVLVDPVLAGAGSSLLITLPTLASDAYTAIAQARRDIVETLDQYAAGQRLLELTTDPRSVAMSPNSQPFIYDPRIGGSEVARPLTGHWPAPLRSALRMANLAARMDAPVASVMLAWGAIESLDVDYWHYSETIAKACALHSLRQQILSVYKSVTDSANARLRHGQWRVSLKQRILCKAERSRNAAARGSSPAAKEAASRLESSVAQARAQLADAESSCAQLERNLLPSIEIVRTNLLHGCDRGHPLNLSSWMLNLNGFLDAILPVDATSAPDLRQTQNAIAILAKQSGGLAEEQLGTWQRRLADPPALGDWLNNQQSIFHGLLAWMYGSRNLAIHTGQFAVPADVLTAQAGRGIIDMVLEFLGHWYQDQHSRGVPDREAKVVLDELADRKDTLVHHLRNATSCHPLNVATITAPGSDPWHRV